DRRTASAFAPRTRGRRGWRGPALLAAFRPATYRGDGAAAPPAGPVRSGFREIETSVIPHMRRCDQRGEFCRLPFAEVGTGRPGPFACRASPTRSDRPEPEE